MLGSTEHVKLFSVSSNQLKNASRLFESNVPKMRTKPPLELSKPNKALRRNCDEPFTSGYNPIDSLYDTFSRVNNLGEKPPLNQFTRFD